MKLSILFPFATLFITGCVALPAPIPSSAHVPVSQDPSPPRPFPKYPLEGDEPLEERDLSALSRFPTEGDAEAHDPSPPRPFPAGRFVSPPLQGRDASAPHKLVDMQKEAVDPSPPRPFPKYPLEGDHPQEKRDPSALSRFPSDEEKEANDPSPPRPFPAGHVVKVEGPSASAAIEPRNPSPLLRTASGTEAEAHDPSPPRPFPAGQPAAMEARAEALPPHRGHGGYFPPTNPPPAASPMAPPHPRSIRLDPNIPTRPHIRHASPTCTTTLTTLAHDLTPTAHSTTVTSPSYVPCNGCALAVTRIDVGNGPPVPSVTGEGTATVYTAACAPSYINL